MGAIYFLFGVSLWLLVCVTHERAETQDVNCLDDVWNFDGDNNCENYTEEIEPNSTTPEVFEPNSTTPEVAVPTKRPKRNDYKDVPFCPPLPINKLENGQIMMLSNQRIKFLCDNGYHLIGPSVIRCYEGKWSSNATPACIIPYFSCDPPEEIPHGSVIGDQWTEGSRILYICDQGYSLQGSRERMCENGYWTSLPPTCQDESEPLKYMADRLKNQFIDKVGSHSSDSRGRSIGSDIQLTGLELFLLIDRSSSIDPVDFKRGIAFAKYLVSVFGASNGVNDIGTGTRISVITFANNANLVIKLNDANIRSKLDAMNRLDSIKPEGGGTAIHQALMTLVGEVALSREKAKKAIFLITDGHNNVGNIPPSEVAVELKKSGIEIFAVGIGRHVNEAELNSIASEPAKNHVFLLNKYSDLSDIIWLIRNSPTEAPPYGTEKCGFLPNLEKKRVPEAVRDWPWLATIYVKFSLKRNGFAPSLGICSGSLICSKWVLTSAGCFYRKGDKSSIKLKHKKDAYVTLGEYDLSRIDATETNFRIRDIILHPKFHPLTGSDYDIALVKLFKSVPLEFTYRPICLPETGQLISILSSEDPIGNMAGWGTVPSSSFLDGNFASDFTILPQVDEVTFIEDSLCKRITPRNATSTFCAGSMITGICSGNLGSPLVVKDSTSNIHYVIGVLSNKAFCKSRYNTFIDVSRHSHWIKRVIKGCQEHH